MLNYLENNKAKNEVDEKWKVLYRKLKDGRYELAGLYDPNVPDEDYGDDLYAVNLSSVYGGEEYMHVNDQVWNAEGTTHDPKPTGVHTWIKFWSDHVIGGVVQCYVNDNEGHTCSAGIVGGHMVVDPNERHPQPGSNGKVRIIPICRTHNNISNDMYLSASVTAVLLNRYYEGN